MHRIDGRLVLLARLRPGLGDRAAGRRCDFALSDEFRSGPFAEFSIDEFVQSGLSTSQGSSSVPMSRKALPFWISVGIKVTGLF